MVEGETQNQHAHNEQEQLDDAPAYGDHTHVKAEKVYLGIWLFGTLALMLLSSVWTESPIFYVFLGYLPLIIVIAFLFGIVEQNFKDLVYWGLPFLAAILFLGIGGLINPLIDYQLSIGGLTVLNLVLGLLCVLGLTLIEGRRLLPEKEHAEVTEENLDDYLHSIEDKCKALNFVIGRVYRTSNGGTKEMRERLRINNEWYNEFNRKAGDDEEEPDALAALHLIHDRLNLFLKKEKELFTEQELKGLKRIARKKTGEDRIIDVLMTNDRDPVESYYVGAVEGARKTLHVLEK